jgi:hypothetical protein
MFWIPVGLDAAKPTQEDFLFYPTDTLDWEVSKGMALFWLHNGAKKPVSRSHEW